MGHKEHNLTLVATAEDEAEAVVRSALAGAGLSRTASSPSLGVRSLPGRIRELAAGMIYGIACEQQAVRLPLVAAALQASLLPGRNCALLTPSDPVMFLRKARLAGFSFEQALEDGTLALFQVETDAAKHLFRSGPQGLLRQLERGFSGREAFLVFDHADPLFALADPHAAAEAAQQYQDWIGSRQHTALAMFTPAAQAPRDYLTLRRIAENFGGFAIVRTAADGPVLEVRHWFGAEGASPRESFSLQPRAMAVAVLRAPRDHAQ